jgi:TPR repeat protein
MEVRPAQSTTYKLAAQGPGGETSASVAIEATPKPPAPKPAEKGEAQYKKAVALRQSGQEEMALALFRQAAEQGYIPAMLEVGEATMEVESGESLLWFRRAADLGDVTGMLHVGAIYQLGIQVEKDYDRAAFWYRQAAEKGNPAAMYNLGRMYESGLG